MLHRFIGEYALALAIAFGVLAWTDRIKTRCVKVLWFDDYFNYLLFYYLAAIGSQILPHLGFRMLPAAGEAGESYYFLFQTFLGLPLVLTFLYYFLRFTDGLSGRSPSPFMGQGYLLVSAIIFLASTFATLWAFQSGNLGALASLQTAITVVALLFLALLPVRAAFRAHPKKDRTYVRSLVHFAAAQIAGLAVGQLLLATVLTDDSQFGHHLVRLLVNLPALVVLARIAEREMAAMNDVSESRMNLEGAFARLDITPREGEIIRLVLQGKTNAEIAAALFISLKTVKHHLYNAYLKLRVKNRVQLVNLFLTFGRPDPPSPK